MLIYLLVLRVKILEISTKFKHISFDFQSLETYCEIDGQFSTNAFSTESDLNSPQNHTERTIFNGYLSIVFFFF